MTYPHSTAPAPLIPNGRIAAIPTQSAESCALVIAALAQELSHVHCLLGLALESYIHQWNTADEVRFECMYWQGWNDAGRLLDELREDWPRLDI